MSSHSDRPFQDAWIPEDGLAGAARHYLEGRVESAVGILERLARTPEFVEATMFISRAMLLALESLARRDPQFRRERRRLQKRLLVLSGLCVLRSGTRESKGRKKRH